MERRTIRTLWVLMESIHSVIYFAPEKVDAYRAAGLKGGWMGYFASRTAPMGPVGPEVVAATFYNFHPDMVARAIPDAWRFSTPEDVLEARHEAASAALQRLVPAERRPPIEPVLDELRSALQELSFAGRPLGAAHAGLPWPSDPLSALWHACTVWREYRGDAHVAALVSEGIGPVEAHLTLAATGATDPETLRINRGWSEQDWEGGRRRLGEAGLLDDEDHLSETGAEVRDRVERLTDERSASPWSELGAEGTGRIIELLQKVVRSIADGREAPFPNPMGLPEAELRHALDAASSERRDRAETL